MWLFALLGARPGDQLDDLFPGSGMIGQQWAAFEAQDALSLPGSFTRHAHNSHGWVPRDWPTLDDLFETDTADPEDDEVA